MSVFGQLLGCISAECERRTMAMKHMPSSTVGLWSLLRNHEKRTQLHTAGRSSTWAFFWALVLFGSLTFVDHASSLEDLGPNCEDWADDTLAKTDRNHSDGHAHGHAHLVCIF